MSSEHRDSEEVHADMQLDERQLKDIKGDSDAIMALPLTDEDLGNGTPPRSNQEIFAGFQLYEELMEQERVRRRRALIAELTTANREQAFVATLRQSAETPLPRMTFEAWLPWWQSLPDVQRQYLEGRIQQARAAQS